jgi:hypothetical protein
MNITRYNELCRSKDATLTQAELDAGWFFCLCEWDGMLLHKSDKEAEYCGCFGSKASSSTAAPLHEGEKP